LFGKKGRGQKGRSRECKKNYARGKKKGRTSPTTEASIPPSSRRESPEEREGKRGLPDTPLRGEGNLSRKKGSWIVGIVHRAGLPEGEKG